MPSLFPTSTGQVDFEIAVENRASSGFSDISFSPAELQASLNPKLPCRFAFNPCRTNHGDLLYHSPISTHARFLLQLESLANPAVYAKVISTQKALADFQSRRRYLQLA